MLGKRNKCYEFFIFFKEGVVPTLQVGKRVPPKQFEWLVLSEQSNTFVIEKGVKNGEYVRQSVVWEGAMPIRSLTESIIADVLNHPRCIDNQMMYLQQLQKFTSPLIYNSLLMRYQLSNNTRNKVEIDLSQEDDEEQKVVKKPKMEKNNLDWLKMATLFKILDKGTTANEIDMDKVMKLITDKSMDETTILKKVGLLLEQEKEKEKKEKRQCMICFTDEDDDLLECSTQKHFGCNDCVSFWVSSKTPTKTSLKCCDVECDGMWDLVKLNVKNTWKIMYEKTIVEECLLLFSCAHCDEQSSLDENYFHFETQQCPFCEEHTCTWCRKKDHGNTECEEEKKEKPIVKANFSITERETLMCGHCFQMGALDKDACLKSFCPNCKWYTCAYCTLPLCFEGSVLCESIYAKHFCRALETDEPGETCKHKEDELHCPLWRDVKSASNVSDEFVARLPHLVPADVLDLRDEDLQDEW